MITETVTDNEFATILYYPEAGIIHHTWKKFCSGKVFRDMMLAASEYLGSHGGSKWLSDDRDYTMMTEDDSYWGRSIWFPKTVHAGWRHWAIILPERQIGHEGMEGIIAEYKAAGINAKIFNDVSEALDWLKTQ